MSNYEPDLTVILDREPPPPEGVQSREVDYTIDGASFRGYLARPADAIARPGVLVVHDWYGVTDHVRMRAEMLARLGYVAFAADIFGADVRPSAAQAPGVVAEYYGNRVLWRERVVGAFARLLEEPNLDQARLAAIGYCFGGATVLQLARTGADLKAVVSFHGNLHTGPTGEAEKIRAKLLVLHGAADPHVPDQEVLAFVNELRAAPTVDWQLVAYSGAMHAFAVPSANSPEHGAQYNSVAEQRSWQAMRSFLAETLQ
jgi:dienelactone hydrolase